MKCLIEDVIDVAIGLVCLGIWAGVFSVWILSGMMGIPVLELIVTAVMAAMILAVIYDFRERRAYKGKETRKSNGRSRSSRPGQRAAATSRRRTAYHPVQHSEIDIPLDDDFGKKPRRRRRRATADRNTISRRKKVC